MGRETRYAVYLLYGCLDVRRYYRGDAYVLWHHNSDCLVAPNKLVASAIAATLIDVGCTMALPSAALLSCPP